MWCDECNLTEICLTKKDEKDLAGCTTGDPIGWCPFCGSLLTVTVTKNKHYESGDNSCLIRYSCSVKCKKCGFSLGGEEYEDKDFAIHQTLGLLHK